MTEDEAKKKWCPWVYLATTHNINCCASDCMMWRWKEEKGRFVAEGIVEEIPIYGYCGLAGKP